MLKNKFVNIDNIGFRYTKNIQNLTLKTKKRKDKANLSNMYNFMCIKFYTLFLIFFMKFEIQYKVQINK